MSFNAETGTCISTIRDSFIGRSGFEYGNGTDGTRAVAVERGQQRSEAALRLGLQFRRVRGPQFLRGGAAEFSQPALGGFARLEVAIAEVCEEHGVPLRVAALHFPFREPAVRCVVVGAGTPEQVRRNAEALATEVARGKRKRSKV